MSTFHSPAPGSASGRLVTASTRFLDGVFGCTRLSGLAIMGLQFGITARFRYVTEPWDEDVMYHFHRQISLLAVALVVVHPLIMFEREQDKGRRGLLQCRNRQGHVARLDAANGAR
jgi:predicted ferric reductase